MTPKEKEEKIIDIMTRVIADIAHYEIREAVEAGTLEEHYLHDASFYHGVMWGIAVANQRIEEITKKINELKKTIRTETEKN